MAFVITHACVDCQETECVDVCPVDCIKYEKGVDRKLYIDPDECIDCGACEPACPTKAIFPEESLPEKWKEYTQLNVDLCKTWPNISEKKDAPPDADQWKDVEEKRQYLEGV